MLFGRRAALELALIGALYYLYHLGRLAISNHEERAMDNAHHIHRLEQVLHLPSEAWIQDSLSNIPHLFTVANTYYVYVHFPITIAFLVWGFVVRPRAEYVWARNVMVVQTFLALTLHFLMPLAPPRMFPDWGFIDTMTLYGPSAYDGASASVANQYAAMPSLHVGWALLIAVVVTRTASRPWYVLAWIHAAVTIAVVTVTANHWWLDGIVAAGLLAVALLVVHVAPARGRPQLVVE